MAGRRGPATDIVQQLRDAISSSGEKLRELERRADIGPGVLSRFMRAERTLTLAVAAKVCRVLGLQLTKPAEAGEGSAGSGDGMPGGVA